MFFFFALFPIFLPVAALASGEKDYEKGDYESAEKYYEDKAAQNPDNYKAQYNLGNSLYGLNRFDEAGDAFEKSVQIKPDFQYGWYNLGLALARQNRLQDSIDSFQRSLDLNPKDKDAEKNLKIVKKKLEDSPKSDQSDGEGKYKNLGKKGKGGGQGQGNGGPTDTPTPVSTYVTPVSTVPPPRKKDEKEDENSKDLRTDPNAKKKMQSKDPNAQPDPNLSSKDGASKKGKGNKGQSNQEEPPTAEQKAQQRQAEQQRRDQAKKELGLNDKQIQTIMSQLQQQEEQTQQYYSANPKKDMKHQGNMWNFLPRQQQEFMRKFFGKPEKDKEVQEDW